MQFNHQFLVFFAIVLHGSKCTEPELWTDRTKSPLSVNQPWNQPQNTRQCCFQTIKHSI